jgi:hypothetical protein
VLSVDAEATEGVFTFLWSRSRLGNFERDDASLSTVASRACFLTSCGVTGGSVTDLGAVIMRDAN